jgi:hypothetical protein
MSKKDHKSDGKEISAESAAAGTADQAQVVQVLKAVTELSATFDQKAFAPSKADEIRHFFSNDNLTRNSLFGEFKKIVKIPNKMNIGICVGAAHFISIAPELASLDGVIFFDINPLFFVHHQILLDCLKAAKDIEEFETMYALDMQRQFKIPEDAGSELLFSFQQKLVGKEFFFLSSETRFQQCKVSVGKMPIAHYCADFLNLDHLKKLLAILTSHNGAVPFLNITNLLQWDESAGKSKSQAALDLFKPFKPRIMHSFSYADYPEKGCMAFLEQSLDVGELQRTAKLATPDLTLKPFDIAAIVQSVHQTNAWVDDLYAQNPDFDPLQFIKALRDAALRQQPMLSLQDKGRAMRVAVDAKRNVTAAHVTQNIFAPASANAATAAAPQSVDSDDEPLDEYFVSTFK